MNDRERAFALLKANKRSEAYKLLLQVCRNNPADIEAWFYLGSLSGQLGRFDDAANCFQNVVARAPESPMAHYNLGLAWRDQGLFEKAVEPLTTATSLAPGNENIFSDLGYVLTKCKRYRDAVAAFEKIVTLCPQEPGAYSSHADACLLAGDLCCAIDSLQKSLRLAPENSSAHAKLGDAYLRLGDLGAAIESYRQAISLSPADPAYASKLLSAFNFSLEYPLPRLFTEARRWGMLHVRRATVAAGPRTLQHTDRKIRIGYMFGMSAMPALSSHILPLLLHYDHSYFDVYCYAGTLESEAGEHFSRRNIEDMDVDVIAKTIMVDEIDILVDLCGHAEGNRLAVFALQPAPVQISYLGYPYTTGLPSVRYRITDSQVDPESTTYPLYTEELLRLDGCSLCYCPGTTTVARQPDTGDGVRFGIAADLALLNGVYLTAVRDILQAVDHAELHIINAELSDPKVRERVAARLLEFGIPAQVIRWKTPGDSEEAQLMQYQQVDILLDTFPVSGFSAMCRALWMGIPVVTLAGDKPSSRTGKSILETVGLAEFVATSVDEYVSKVLALLEDRPGLAALHKMLHQKMSGSALCDSATFVRNVEAAYLELAIGHPRRPPDHDVG